MMPGAEKTPSRKPTWTFALLGVPLSPLRPFLSPERLTGWVGRGVELPGFGNDPRLFTIATGGSLEGLENQGEHLLLIFLCSCRNRYPHKSYTTVSIRLPTQSTSQKRNYRVQNRSWDSFRPVEDATVLRLGDPLPTVIHR